MKLDTGRFSNAVARIVVFPKVAKGGRARNFVLRYQIGEGIAPEIKLSAEPLLREATPTS